MDAAALTEKLKAKLPKGVRGSHCFRGDATMVLDREVLAEAARTLKEDDAFRMDFLMDMTAVDYSAFERDPGKAFFASSGLQAAAPSLIEDGEKWPGPPGKERFAVVYHFYSSTLRHRLRLTVPVAEGGAEVDSLTALWPGADWLEREVWDMFGIRFKGHPGLKRILMYEEFEGHPLRKDYPVAKEQPIQKEI